MSETTNTIATWRIVVFAILAIITVHIGAISMGWAWRGVIHLTLGVLIFLIIPLIIQQYLKSSYPIALLATLASCCFVVLLFDAGYSSNSFSKRIDSLHLVHVASQAGVFFFIVPLVIQLYRKWVLGLTTPEERLPNMEGVRAWLSPGNVVCCVGFAFCAWLGYGAPFFQYLFISLAVLITYPLINMLSYSSTRSKEQADEIARARDKILQMLQEGKINVAESRELLEALGEKREGG